MPQREPLVSNRVAEIQLSVIKEMAMLGAAVPDAVSLAWGLPSFRTPDAIRSAVKRALDEDPDVGKYSLPDGLPALRESIAARHAAQTGIEIDPNDNVLVTAGNMQGMSTLMHVLVDEGDEVIMTDPGFASHVQQIRLAGGIPRYWKLDEAAGWRLDVGALEALITNRTKAIVLVSPSNPTGRIFSRDDLLRTVAIAKRHHIMVLLDDPYSALTYENKDEFYNLASSTEHADVVAYLFTFSKCFAMSGWRLGYMVVPPAIKREALKVHDANLICAPRVSQMAGLAALGLEPSPVVEFESILAKRRDLICERLDAVPHVFDYIRPQGAYYVFPRIVAAHEDSREFAVRVLNDAKVTVTPGSGFGPAGEHHVRLAFCVDENVINIAFDRIERHFRGTRA